MQHVQMMMDRDDKARMEKKLQETHSHFTSLFTRLDSLAEICNIHLQSEKSWKEIETAFGMVKITSNGDVMIDNNVWNQMSKAFKQLSYGKS